MPKKPKALDLAGWRKSQLVTAKDGTRSMTQVELGRKLGVGKSLVCRMESGERWPSLDTWAMLWRIVKPATNEVRFAIHDGQLALWRAYSADRKGKTP